MGIYNHTGNLTLQHLLRAGNHTTVLLIRTESHDTTGHIVLFHRTITDNHSLVQSLGIRLHRNQHICCCNHFTWEETHVSEHQGSPLFTFDLKLTFQIRRSDGLSTLDRDLDACQWFTQVILHKSFHSCLCKGTDTEYESHKHDPTSLHR